MGPDEIKAWSDAVGPSLIAVIALAVVIIPVIWRARSEKHETAADVQVDIALFKERLGTHKERLDDHHARLEKLEDTKPKR